MVSTGEMRFALLLALLGQTSSSPIAGVWTLNRSLSDMPREIGFTAAWAVPPGGRQTGGSGGGGGGRGRRGSSGGGSSTAAPPILRESYDDSRRVQLLTGEARNPPARLMIVDRPDAITITNELGQSRVLHPTGREETVEVEGVTLFATTRRDGDRLVVVYRLEQERQVRYTYSRSGPPTELVAEVEFLERGAGDKAKRIYEPGIDTEPSTSAAPPSAAANETPGSRPAQPDSAFDERPGAELRGIKTLGVLVEDLSPQAAACGLSRDALEASLAKRLTDAGFQVRRNSDEDTYLYVNVITNALPTGGCVSRYDAFLYTHATANVSYRDRPVLVQVSLMHRGGIGTSAAAAHGSAVTRGLEGYVDLFVSQIRDANK